MVNNCHEREKVEWMETVGVTRLYPRVLLAHYGPLENAARKRKKLDSSMACVKSQ